MAITTTVTLLNNKLIKVATGSGTAATIFHRQLFRPSINFGTGDITMIHNGGSAVGISLVKAETEIYESEGGTQIFASSLSNDAFLTLIANIFEQANSNEYFR